MEVKGIGEKRFERYGTISRLGDTRQKPPSGGFVIEGGNPLCRTVDSFLGFCYTGSNN